MSAKPTTVSRFGGTSPTSPSVEVTEPTSGKKDTGWSAGEQPPHNVMTWLAFYAYAWQQYLSDGDFRGPHTIRQSTEATYTPLLVGLDPSNASRRATIDHNGFRMGQVSEMVDEWRGSSTSIGWTDSGTGSIGNVNPASGRPYRTVQLDAASGQNHQRESDYFAYLDDDTTLVWEFDVRTGGSINIGTSVAIRAQLFFDHAAAVDRQLCFVAKPDDNANWITDTIDGIGTDPVSTGVAIAINTTYRFRIEVVGANNHDSTNMLVRFFVNGSMIRSKTIASWLPDIVKARARIENAGAATTYTAYFGPMRRCWNHRATPDNL